MVFPQLLDALNRNDLDMLMAFEGFLLHLPGLIIISNLNRINRPECSADFRFNLDFLEKKQVETGRVSSTSWAKGII